MIEDKYEPPGPSTADTAHLVVGSLLSVIPGLQELFQYFITPPFQKRQVKWMEDVGKALQELEEDQGVKLEELQTNDIFIDTVLHATQIALRNSQSEKREALKNAIINAALPNPPDESVQLMFLNLVDTFTVWHLRILRLFQNPQNWFTENNKPIPTFGISSLLSRLLTIAYPELGNQREFYDLIISELDAKGLYSGGSTHAMMSATGAFEKRTTDLGDKFLQFITTPSGQ
ncbi:MAG: hypothetical protein KJ069_00915 [Anaerolineae bacterium]|nr:hypothetical protein [Anaerolineae bacterium]